MVTDADYQTLLARTLRRGARSKREALPATKKKSGRVPHTIGSEDGYTFHSGKELERYRELKLLQQGKVIRDLQVHTSFALVVNGKKIGTYTDDFDYWEKRVTYGREKKRLTEEDIFVVEDCKSTFTRKDPHYRRQRKLMEACHGITIREIIK